MTGGVKGVSARMNKDGTVTWRVNFRIDGKQAQESFATEKGAVSFKREVDRNGGAAARALRQIRSGGTVGVPTLAEFTASYLDPDSGLLTGITEGTRAGYEAIARASFLQVLGEYPIDAIEKKDVGRWVSWQERQPSQRTKGQTVAAKTVRNYHALLSNILATAVDEKLRTDNPAKRTKLTPGEAREAVFLTREEFARLYEATPEYYRPLVAFLVGTGARWGEATALRWSEVNTDVTPPNVRIIRAWKKAAKGAPLMSIPKTSRSRRTISLWPEMVALLGEPSTPGEFVFQGKMNHDRMWYGPFNSRIWGPSVERAGLSKRPNIHDLRHTHASWLIDDGRSMYEVQARLGHESITTTIDRYSHLMPDAHTRLADSMQASMAHVLPPRLELAS